MTLNERGLVAVLVSVVVLAGVIVLFSGCGTYEGPPHSVVATVREHTYRAPYTTVYTAFVGKTPMPRTMYHSARYGLVLVSDDGWRYTPDVSESTYRLYADGDRVRVIYRGTFSRESDGAPPTEKSREVLTLEAP